MSYSKRMTVGAVLLLALGVSAEACKHEKPRQAQDAGAATTAATAADAAVAEAAPLAPRSGDAGASASSAPDPALVAKGEALYRSQVCATCHTNNGAQGTGPTFRGLYGKEQKLQDGSTVKVDDAYIRESILNPAAKVAEGFLPLMPNYQGRLSDQDIDALIAYLKSLR